MKYMAYEQYIQLIDGKLAWDMQATHGLPIDITLEFLWEKRTIPTWDRLLLAASKDGTKIPNLVDRICLYAEYIYPKQIADHVKSNLHEVRKRIRV